MNKGILSSLFGWINYPIFSEGDTVDWFAGIILILIAAFFWSMILKQME